MNFVSYLSRRKKREGEEEKRRRNGQERNKDQRLRTLPDEHLKYDFNSLQLLKPYWGGHVIKGDTSLRDEGTHPRLKARLAVVGLTGHALLLYLDIPEVERSHDEYRKKHKLSPPLLICKYCLEDPDKERLRNIYSLAFLLGQNPDTYMFTNIGNVCHCLLDVTQLGLTNPQHVPLEVLAIEGRQHTFQFHFNTLRNIGVVDFTLDDVLDEPVGVGGTIEPPKCVTDTPPSLESVKLEDAVKLPEPILQRVEGEWLFSHPAFECHVRKSHYAWHLQLLDEYSPLIEICTKRRRLVCGRQLGNSEYFPVDVGLHQGSAISPYLFALILDELSRGIQESILWCLIFADDIVLVSDTPDGLNERLEQWREMLEDKGLRVSREKTEYMRCDFNRNENDQNEEAVIRIGEHILEPKESFRYLRYVIYKFDKIEDYVTHRIQAGWLKWRAATGILYEKNVPLKLKGKFYRVATRPAMMYGSECWPLTKVQANRMEVAEIRMLRWTYGHVKRRPQSAPIRRVETIVVDGVRRRGRPKLKWEDRLKADLKELLLSEDMTSDRIRVDEVDA
ncbi:ataxia telangiectasia mutated family protein [Tanacetum coccineum]